MASTVTTPPAQPKKKYRVIYPVYINAKKTIPEGRQIAKDKACENPTATEVFDVVKHLGFPCELEVCLWSK